MDCCSHEGPSKGDAKFDIQKVADGVHVAVAAPAYKVNCNTAIIESDDGVVIVDTHSKPSAARLIVQELRDLTTKPVRYVVNTHFHWDHWHGNEVYPAAYPNAEIITNQITREAMAEASRVVLDGFEVRTDMKVTRYPERFSDPRGRRMWGVVSQLIEEAEATAARAVA